MSPRIRSAYDLYLLKRLKNKKKTAALESTDRQIEDLVLQYAVMTRRLNVLSGEDYESNKAELEYLIGEIEEMLEAVILTGLEMA